MSRNGHTSIRNRSGIVLAMTVVVVLAGVISFVAVAPASAASTQINSCTVINQPGRYELTQDITESTDNVCIEIQSSDVIFDGNGHTIDGVDTDNTNGVYGDGLHGAFSNVTVRNVTVIDWSTGISYFRVDNGMVADVTATSNRFAGFTISGSGHTLIDNTAMNNGYMGFGLYGNNNTFSNNTASGNVYGIFLDGARNNTLTRNTVTDNTAGIALSSAAGDNLIYDNYLENDDNVVFTPDFAGNANTWNVLRKPGPNIIGGPMLGGNYYAKPGSAKGYSERCADTNGDGFCDQPYVLGAPNNIDNLPLTQPTPTSPSKPDIAVSSTSLDFGSVQVGDSTTKTITVTNEGNAQLTVSAITLGGPDDSAFSVSNGGSFSLAPGDSHTMTVEFAPSSDGAKRATLSIQSNDPDEATVSVALNGTGVKQQPPTEITEQPPTETTEQPPTETTEQEVPPDDGDTSPEEAPPEEETPQKETPPTENAPPEQETPSEQPTPEQETPSEQPTPEQETPSEQPTPEQETPSGEDVPPEEAPPEEETPEQPPTEEPPQEEPPEEVPPDDRKEAPPDGGDDAPPNDDAPPDDGKKAPPDDEKTSPDGKDDTPSDGGDAPPEQETLSEQPTPEQEAPPDDGDAPPEQEVSAEEPTKKEPPKEQPPEEPSEGEKPPDDADAPPEEVSPSEPAVVYYQIDFVADRPLKQLSTGGDVYTSEELVRFAHGDTEESITRRSEGEFTTNATLARCLDTTPVHVADGTAFVNVTVSEDCGPVVLSLVSYTKPGPGWNPEMEHLQEFVDADSRTLTSGESATFTVSLPGTSTTQNETSQQNETGHDSPSESVSASTTKATETSPNVEPSGTDTRTVTAHEQTSQSHSASQSQPQTSSATQSDNSMGATETESETENGADNTDASSVSASSKSESNFGLSSWLVTLVALAGLSVAVVWRRRD